MELDSKVFTMKKILFLFLITIIIGTGCSKKTTEISPEIASNDEALYNMGEQYIKKNPEKGRLYFRQIIDSFPKSFYAQRAKLAIADSYFEKGDEGSMIISASEYREFTNLFPYSPSAAYAQYQIGMTFYEKALKPERDQFKTNQALSEFKLVVTKYPLSEEANQAREKIQECEDRLTEHSLSIAVFYYNSHAYKAAISRLTEIITKFPGYSRMDKIYFYLADSNFNSKLYDQSTPYFRKVITDYPQSEFAKKSTARLKEIESIKKKIEK
jgi:outer membrane protein assembly factor BamD